MDDAIVIKGARLHNLKNVTVAIPKNKLVVLTGFPARANPRSPSTRCTRKASANTSRRERDARRARRDQQLGAPRQIATIDQQAIGRGPRSNAATYSDAFTPIREAFAATAGARERGLTPRHFSFNVSGGRCERCEGAGVLTVQMHFLPDVRVRCPAGGNRAGERVADGGVLAGIVTARPPASSYRQRSPDQAHRRRDWHRNSAMTSFAVSSTP